MRRRRRRRCHRLRRSPCRYAALAWLGWLGRVFRVRVRIMARVRSGLELELGLALTYKTKALTLTLTLTRTRTRTLTLALALALTLTLACALRKSLLGRRRPALSLSAAIRGDSLRHSRVRGDTRVLPSGLAQPLPDIRSRWLRWRWRQLRPGRRKPTTPAWGQA